MESTETARASAFKLIKTAFPDLTTADARALTPEDRVQLASGIARNMGLAPEALAFVPVEY